MPQFKPHRRLSLTSPTIGPATSDEGGEDSEIRQAETIASAEIPPVASENSVNDSMTVPSLKSAPVSRKTLENATVNLVRPEKSPANEVNGEIVRVMAYLAADESATLDDLWLGARRAGVRASKSDILRAALRFSSQKSDELMITLSQQHTSTLSRHRDSKMRRAEQSSR